MAGLLAIAPVLIAGVLLALRRPAWLSATAGLLGAAISALAAFPTPSSVLANAAADYAPLIVEVALILLFGMLLAALLEASGAMRVLSRWVETIVPNLAVGVALVVFGIVPFAESVTGFGIGVTIGVPILRHLGCSLRHSALLGLLGLIAVPWGALGPGTTVAAALAGLDVDALGAATAWVNAIPIAVALVTVGLIMRPSLGSAVGIAIAAVLLWAGILVANLVVGMAPAGIIGSLIVIAGFVAPLAVRSHRPRSGSASVRSRHSLVALGWAALPYATLTAGILLARGVVSRAPSPVTDVLASPPAWLAVACLVAVAVRQRIARQNTEPTAPVETRRPLAPVATSAGRSWVPIGAATAAFMLMGWVMTTTGMSEAIGGLLPAGLLLLTPWLTTAGAVLTGSNTGSNAMFAGTLASAAGAAGAAPMTVVAAGNAAGSFAALAAPPRAAMAVDLAGGAEAGAGTRSWVLSRAFLVIAVNALVIGLWLQVSA